MASISIIYKSYAAHGCPYPLSLTDQGLPISFYLFRLGHQIAINYRRIAEGLF
jgi:hypothetical protein